MRINLKLGIFGFFGFVLASCGQGNFGLRDLSSDMFSIPEGMIHNEKTECVGDGIETIYVPELIGGGALLFTEATQIQTGQLHLKLFSDGHFEARYREFDFFEQIFEQNLSGSYTLDSRTRRVYLQGLGDASIERTRNSYKMTLTFRYNYNSTLLLGQSISLRIFRYAVPQVRVAGCQ